MRKIIFLLSCASAFCVAAQTAPAPTQPIRPSVAPRLQNPNQQQTIQNQRLNPVVGVVSNAIGNAGNYLSNRFALSNAMVYSNLFGGTQMEIEQVATGLETLQQNIEQLLPALAGLSGRVGGAAGNQNMGGNTGTAGTVSPNPNYRPGGPWAQANPYLRATGNPNQYSATGNGQVPATATGQPVIGMLGTNAFQTDQQTYQMLLALQNNLQQALPVLRTLNASGTLPDQPAVYPGTTTQPLTPTGFTGRFNRILQQEELQNSPMENPNGQEGQ